MVDSARRAEPSAEPSAELIGLDPTSGQRQERRAAARRPLTLDGAVVALVGNGLGQTEAFMGALYSELKAHAALAGAVPVCKASASRRRRRPQSPASAVEARAVRAVCATPLNWSGPASRPSPSFMRRWPAQRGRWRG